MSDQFFDHVASITDLVKQSVLVSFRNLLEVEFKSDESPVTKADLEAENLVRQYLAKHFPQDGIFGEEFGIEGVERENVWVVDPIDGTRSFLSGHPTFGFLLARLKAGIPELGVIAMPALNETLIGHRGIGASLNGKTVQVSSQKSLDQAILYVNEGDKIYKIHPDTYIFGPQIFRPYPGNSLYDLCVEQGFPEKREHVQAFRKTNNFQRF